MIYYFNWSYVLMKKKHSNHMLETVKGFKILTLVCEFYQHDSQTVSYYHDSTPVTSIQPEILLFTITSS